MVEDSRIIIPIEISTEESTEIRKLIQDIKSVEGKEIGTTKRLPRVMRSGGGPSDIDFGEEEGFGIFSSVTSNRPSKFRDRTSKQATQRINKLEERLSNLEQLQDIFTQGLSAIKNPLGFATDLISRFGKIAGIIGVAVAAKEAYDLVIHELTRAGGWLDRRFKRFISEEVLPLLSRTIKAQLRVGVREVRISAYAGQRGGIVGTNLLGVRDKNPIYDIDLKKISVGID